MLCHTGNYRYRNLHWLSLRTSSANPPTIDIPYCSCMLHVLHSLAVLSLSTAGRFVPPPLSFSSPGIYFPPSRTNVTKSTVPTGPANRMDAALMLSLTDAPVLGGTHYHVFESLFEQMSSFCCYVVSSNTHSYCVQFVL